ncbi:CREA protein [Haematobacter missouriensis]|uniref:CREA protein n=1 Tax=Haematobacter missouriensis TaxID=366616 RepID=A0A212APR1_9RHOB|nr:CreA family protein [Haematobacter missouriensis]KFI31034.1 CREA protein [Haematobacter missouriensis]OWJ73972.1 CREA protein [Haematobacter missouriensis]OWJ83492.1 CREA protein [Haematobacter missouriensis]
MRRIVIALSMSFAATTAFAEEVGRIGVDWMGNDVVVEAFDDPKVQGVTCHVAYFSRSTIDRLRQGNWFEDPSNSAISCAKVGPVTLGDIEKGPKGEEVFSERRSIIFKSLKVRRIYDEAHHTLIYVSHGDQVVEGSAKMAISTVALD